MCGIDYKKRTKTSSRRTNNIEILLEQLESLQITNKISDKVMSVALVPVMIDMNEQTVMPKNIVPDPEWFDGDKIKFEDW